MNKKIRRPRIPAPVIILLMTLSALAFQNTTPPVQMEDSATITITGEVIQQLGAQNITLEIKNEVNFVLDDHEKQSIIVDPITTPPTYDPEFSGSGYIVAKGEPYASFRLSFSQNIILRNPEDGNLVTVEYLISSNDFDEQASSSYVKEITPEFTLNENGEFHFWIGGRISLTDLTEGLYEGEFLLDLEYL